jgi:hypothetical protein
MKLTPTTKLFLLLAALPVAAWAQQTNSGRYMTPEDTRPGTGEFTISANGASNTDLNDSFGGANASLGWYINNSLQWMVRQSINYTNPRNAGRAWSGTTRLALDQNLNTIGRFRPYIGINGGRIYGNAVHDTWTAGLEGGAKFYVQPRTFVFTQVDYAWNFDRGRQIDNNFSNGQYQWGVGLGFNF